MARNGNAATLAGAGLPEGLAGAGAVIDVSNAPSLDGDASLEFFRTATGNLLAAEQQLGVRHHVALSVVGSETARLAAFSAHVPTRRSLSLA